jgi:hypothetical protein
MLEQIEDIANKQADTQPYDARLAGDLYTRLIQQIFKIATQQGMTVKQLKQLQAKLTTASGVETIQNEQLKLLFQIASFLVQFIQCENDAERF